MSLSPEEKAQLEEFLRKLNKRLDEIKPPIPISVFLYRCDSLFYTKPLEEMLVEKEGGETTSSVSGKIDYLVVGENPDGKLDEAKDLDLKIIKEGDFKNLIDDNLA
jgi:DNA ligase (NAD+)